MPSSSVDILSLTHTFFSLLGGCSILNQPPHQWVLQQYLGSNDTETMYLPSECVPDWSMLRYTPSTISLEDLCMSSSMVESYGYGTHHYVSNTVYYDKDSVRGGFMCHAFDMCFKDMSYPYAIQYGNVPSFMSYSGSEFISGKQYQVYTSYVSESAARHNISEQISAMVQLGLSENSEYVKASTFAGFRQENPCTLCRPKGGKDYTMVKMSYSDNNNICVEPSEDVCGKSPNSPDRKWCALTKQCVEQSHGCQTCSNMSSGIQYSLPSPVGSTCISFEEASQVG